MYYWKCEISGEILAEGGRRFTCSIAFICIAETGVHYTVDSIQGSEYYERHKL